jgi:hypothetical protein
MSFSCSGEPAAIPKNGMLKPSVRLYVVSASNFFAALQRDTYLAMHP